jgi:hypothetical protein
MREVGVSLADLAYSFFLQEGKTDSTGAQGGRLYPCHRCTKDSSSVRHRRDTVRSAGVLKDNLRRKCSLKMLE